MKFTNGFWLTKEEFTPEYVRGFYCVEESDEAVRAFGPYREIRGRGIR